MDWTATGVIVSAAIGVLGLVIAYKALKKQEPEKNNSVESSQINNETASNIRDQIATGNVVNIHKIEQIFRGFSLEEVDKLLEHKEKINEEKLKHLSEKETKKRKVIEKELVEVKKQRSELEVTVENKNEEIFELNSKLQALQGKIAPEKLNDAIDALDKGDTKVAELLLIEVLETKTNDSELLSTAAHLLGWIAYNDIDYEKALHYFLEAIKLQPEKSSSHNNIGNILGIIGRYKDAEYHLNKSIDIDQELYGENNREIIKPLIGLSNAYRNQNLFDKSEETLIRAYKIAKREFGDEHPTIGLIYSDLAVLATYQKKYDKAEKYNKKSLMIREKVFGREHHNVANNLNTMASLYALQGRNNDVIPLHRRVLRIREKDLGSNHYLVANSLNNLAVAYISIREYREADKNYKRAIKIIENVCGDESPELIVMLKNYATNLKRLNRHAMAKEIFARAEDIEKKTGINKS